MFDKIKRIFIRDKNSVQQQRGVDVPQSSLTPEEKRKIEKAAQFTVKQYGPIIERLSKE